jgi:hypothetical protein
MEWFIVLFPMAVIALRPLLPSPTWFPALPWLLSMVVLAFGFTATGVYPHWDLFWFVFFVATAFVGFMWARNSR